MKQKVSILLILVLVFAGAISSLPDIKTKNVTEAASTDISYYLDMSQLEGYATVSANGIDSVTGGGDAPIQVVTTAGEFSKAVSGDSPAVIVVSGTINAVTSGGSAINIGSNKTIVGIDENATLTGGINISGESNIIVSNLTMKGYLKQSRTPDDVINVENGSHHIWFNHLDISDGGDGNLDIKSGSDYITVSWCKFYYTDKSHDHRLSCLIGSGAGDHDDTDYNRLHVTYHHNWYADYVKERMPRVMYGRAHVYNNYYTSEGNSYCIGVDCYGAALIENNYFYKVNNPHQFMYDSNQMPCTITARDNIYIETSGQKDDGPAPNKLGSVDPMDVMPYAYWLDKAEDVPEIVSKYAGPQPMDPDATPHPTAAPTPDLGPTSEPTARPLVSPSPTPQLPDNDKPFTLVDDDEHGTSILFNGQNSDGENGYYIIKNPFAGLDLSETPKYNGVNPVWKKAITISYWQYMPSGTDEAVAFAFNGVHRAVRDVDWIWYEDRNTAGYTNRFEDNGGTFSLVREGNVRTGLQLSTFGSFAFSEDDMTAWQINPYSGEYAMTMNIQDKNYLYYNANTEDGSQRTSLVTDKGKWHHVTYVISNDNILMYVDGTKISTSYYNYWGNSIKSFCSGQSFNLGTGWAEARRYSSDSPMYAHGITLLDFISLENTEFTIGGKAALRPGVGPADFKTPKGIKIAQLKCYDKALSATQIKDIMAGNDISVEELPLSLEELPDATATPKPVATATPEPVVTATPDPDVTATPEPVVTATPDPDVTATPEPVVTATPDPDVSQKPDEYTLGDVNGDTKVDANDALLVLQSSAKIIEFNEIQFVTADVNKDKSVNAVDALKILQLAAKLIDSFE